MTLNLHYKKQGSGPDLILLHGLFGSMSNLQMIARHLGDRFTVYSLDHRNHGRSPHDDKMDYPAMANDVLSFIKEHRIHEPILIGHSMGGKVAMLSSLLRPDLIKRLLLLDIAPVNYQHDYDNVFSAMKDIRLDSIQSRTDADTVLQQYFRNTDFRQFLLQNLLHTELGYEWRINLPVIIKNIHKIVGWPEISDLEYPGKTLFIGGKASDFIQKKYEPKIFELFPSASIEMLEDCGHWLHAEQPQMTLELIDQFLHK